MSVDLNDPDVQAAIKQAVQEATDGLSSKNSELLAEVKKLKKETGIKPEDLDRLEAERDEALKQRDESQKALKQLTKDFEKVTNDHKTEAAFTQKLLVDNGLTEALVSVGVKEPAHLKAVKALLKEQVQIVADGDNRVAKVGDKALAEFAKEWAASDEGKHFVSAPVNSGGGAQGGGGNSGQKTISRTNFDAMSQQERFAFAKDGGKVID
jgi:hypothetical protein